MAKRKNIDFEASLAQLEVLVDQMEDGDLTLEESLKAFEQGMKLTRDCQAALKEAEQKVEVLMQRGSEVITEPLDDVTDEDDEDGVGGTS
ncbi:MAG: exodeoxyribonuclease VII small subunit [Halieaceae bacterium]|jgi:exodeoxyribonuclease VII small subunit|nr:exodeoxyribonuclease VII small subunit [Halieaceae bacterium]